MGTWCRTCTAFPAGMTQKPKTRRGSCFRLDMPHKEDGLLRGCHDSERRSARECVMERILAPRHVPVCGTIAKASVEHVSRDESSGQIPDKDNDHGGRHGDCGHVQNQPTSRSQDWWVCIGHVALRLIQRTDAKPPSTSCLPWSRRCSPSRTTQKKERSVLLLAELFADGAPSRSPAKTGHQLIPVRTGRGIGLGGSRRGVLAVLSIGPPGRVRCERTAIIGHLGQIAVEWIPLVEP